MSSKFTIHRFALYRYCIIIKLCSSDHEILQCRRHYSARSIDKNEKKKEKEKKEEKKKEEKKKQT